MNCPYCNEEMKLGYIDQTDFRFPLEWYPAIRKEGIFVSRKGNIKLTAAHKGGALAAYRCARCKKLIIDENTLEV